MSWYVEFLLLNRDAIKSSIYKLEYDRKDYNIDNIMLDADLDDSTYNDLLDVERTLKKLIDNKLLEQSELESTYLMIHNQSFASASKNSNLTRKTISRNFNSLCNKIAYYLGGYFTNEGYIDYLAEKYNLTDKQIEKVIEFLNSNYKQRGVKLI